MHQHCHAVGAVAVGAVGMGHIQHELELFRRNKALNTLMVGMTLIKTHNKKPQQKQTDS
jgi:hypothetical protein